MECQFCILLTINFLAKLNERCPFDFDTRSVRYRFFMTRPAITILVKDLSLPARQRFLEPFCAS